jgi:Calx-beta domain/RTX calcium-binding nonapeptide repeat (4 copies)/von Willebrand factor type A domain
MAITNFDDFAVVNFLPDPTTGEVFNPFERFDIFSYMRGAYNFSSTAKQMFDSWGSKPINVTYRKDTAAAKPGTGNIFIDLNYIDGLSYVDTQGKAQQYSRIGAVIHEVCHALTGLKDNITPTDYKGDNVLRVNQIWEEIRQSNGTQAPLLKEMASYTATSRDPLQLEGYEYTGGASIDAAYNVEQQRAIETSPGSGISINALFNQGTGLTEDDFSSAPLGNSRDLLIGGLSPNKLFSGAGDDFLFGGKGNDTLNGGAGNDTAVYFGSKLDYDINKNQNGTWTVSNKRGAKDAGTDTLINIESVQFDNGNFLFPGKETFKLTANGLTFQNDFALVIDTTGSMGSSINSVKAQASSLIEAVFANGNYDGRIGVVSFKDTANGEPSQVILPFTGQDEFADRKSAALAAISSLTVGGGGDTPETALDGLKVALNGSMGQWRFGAGTLRIALFTDAPAKDGALAAEVTTLAKNIGATIASSSTTALSSGLIDTFNLKLSSIVSLDGLTGSGDPSLALNATTPLSEDPISSAPTTAQVQIFTIFTGPQGTDTAALSQIANANGGAFLTAPTNDELVKQLLAIINAPPVTQPPTISIANISQAEGNSNTTNYGFDITLNKSSTETVTVKYTTADGTATAVSDYTTATGTVTFNPGETSKTVNISVKGDTLELDETFTVNLADAVGGTISKAIATATIVDDDRPVIALTTPDANASEDKKDPGLFNLTRTGSTAQALTVNYAIAGTATNDTDYKKLTGTATFKAGQSQTSIEIKPIDDKIYEGSETVILTLNDGGTNYKFDPVANTGTVTIADEDLPSISLSMTDDKAAETKIGEVANPGQFTLKRTGNTTDVLTVSYILDGSASNGIDYQKLDNSVTFAAGSDTAIINIRPIDDQLAEETETIKLKLSDNNSYKVDGEKSSTIKIADNDHPRKIDAKDLVLKVENLAEANSLIGTGLQSGSEGELIDLRSFAGQTLKVDTISVSDAAYRNYIGFYAVEDAQGQKC